jgi:outer membrane scaffolding protein for murein synthesis (MipA/OmpV family)
MCTIIPASIEKYYQHKNNTTDTLPNFKEEQDLLVDDISSINDHLKQAELAIDIARRFIKSSLKRKRSGDRSRMKRKFKFEDNELVDGVHLSKVAEDQCFDIVLKAVANRVRNEEEEGNAISAGELDTSQESTEEWNDFKRRK